MPSAATGRATGVLSALLVLIALFLPSVLEGLYEGLALTESANLGLLAQLFFFVSLWSWFWSYSRTHRITWPMDMAWFLVLAWPVLVPYYLFKAEGRRAWALIGIYVLATVGAWRARAAISVWLRVLMGAR